MTLIGDGLNVAIQGRFLKPLFGNTDAAKPSYAPGIYDMEGQFFVTETERGFDHGATQHLISTHAFGAGALRFVFALMTRLIISSS